MASLAKGLGGSARALATPPTPKCGGGMAARIRKSFQLELERRRNRTSISRRTGEWRLRCLLKETLSHPTVFDVWKNHLDLEAQESAPMG